MAVANTTGVIMPRGSQYGSNLFPASGSYNALAISSDGTKILAGANGGRLWYLNGLTWTQQQPAGGVDRYWNRAALSSDGAKMLAVCSVTGGRVWYYNGSSWADQQPDGDANRNWIGCALSSDGTKMLAGINSGRLWYYNGSSWAEQQPDGANNRSWSACALSSDGTKMLVGANGGRLWYYNGSTWAEQQPAGNVTAAWKDCALSSDGTKMLAVVENGRVWYYNGSAWGEQQPAGAVNKAWQIASLSSDGTKMLVGNDGGGLGGRVYFYSSSAWRELFPLGATNQTWAGGRLSGDGNIQALSKLDSIYKIYTPSLINFPLSYTNSNVTFASLALTTSDQKITKLLLPNKGKYKIQVNFTEDYSLVTATTGSASIYSLQTSTDDSTYTAVANTEFLGMSLPNISATPACILLKTNYMEFDVDITADNTYIALFGKTSAAVTPSTGWVIKASPATTGSGGIYARFIG